MDFEPMAKSLGRAIRSNRVRWGLSQEAFAARAGVDRTYMSDVERGERNVSLRNLLLISDALRLRLSALIAEAEEIARLPDED